MIDLRCGCGARGQVGAELAGRRVKCRQCGAAVLVPTPVAASVGGEGAYEIAPEPSPPPPRPRPAVVHAGREPEAPRRSRVKPEPVGTGPAFVRDVMRAFVFFASLPNAMMFGFLLIVAALTQLAPWFVSVIGYGALCAYYFETIVSSAAGDRDLPQIDRWEGVWESAILPMLSFVGTALAVATPALLALWLLPMAGAGEGATVAVAVALGAVGAFFWPVALLMVAVGDLGSLVRVDLVVRTPMRSFPAYLVAVGGVGLAILAHWWFAGQVLAAEMLGHPERDASEEWLADKTVAVVAAMAEVYTWVVASRVIGAYYHRYSHRFPWSAG